MNFIKRFESTVRECWDKPAIGEYEKEHATYGQFAHGIETFRMVCDSIGLKPGDRIAINAGNSYCWALVFMASTVLGYTSVLILKGCTPDTVQGITHNAGCKVLFTEKPTFAGMQFEQLPGLLGVVDLQSMELLAARGNKPELYLLRDKLFSARHRHGFGPEDVSYMERNMEDLCCVIYTSGSTGNPKGVMLTGQNFQNYVDYIPGMFQMEKDDSHVNMLPFAHLFGLAYDMLAPLCLGQTVTIITARPTPSLLGKVLREIRPATLFFVPMVLNKYVTSVIGKNLKSREGRMMLENWESYSEWFEVLKGKVIEALGGNVRKIMSAGAAASLDMEDIMVKVLRLPYVTGYGLTECAPLITLSRTESYRRGSCGKVLDWVKIRIDSPDERKVPGEILAKSKFVFGGYYLNPEATAEAFTKDGWFRTGDMGTIDEEGHVMLSGRCKNMLLTSNGQNVYPEEIEAILGNMPFVSESLIVQRKETFGALIVPSHEVAGMSEEDLNTIMDSNIAMLNARIPTYERITWWRLEREPFEKTPKGSIKRFVYQDKENRR